jgi:hypothetical protein
MVVDVIEIAEALAIPQFQMSDGAVLRRSLKNLRQMAT